MPYKGYRKTAARKKTTEVGMSEQEFASVSDRARNLGLPLATYLRRVALGEVDAGYGAKARIAIDPAAVELVRRLGTDARGLVRAPARLPPDLKATADRLAAAADRLVDLLAAGPVTPRSAAGPGR